LFFPQTSASLSERLRVLDVLRKETPEVTWQLLLGLLPKNYVVGDLGPLPRWRDFSETEAEDITWPLVWRGGETIAGWLFEGAGAAAHRWKQLIEVFAQFSPGRRTEMIMVLKDAASRMTFDEDRIQVWQALRHLLSHHRKFAQSDWALPESELAEIESAYGLYEPRDPISRITWLFSRLEALAMEADSQESDRLRCLALQALHEQFGEDAFFRLARAEEVLPSLIGVAVAHATFDGGIKDRALIRSLRSKDASEAGIADGLVFAIYQTKGEAWSEGLLHRAVTEQWGPEETVRLLLIMPNGRKLWERIADFGEAVEKLYWARMRPFLPPNISAAEFEFLATKLISNERAYEAVGVLTQGKDIVSSSLVAEALEAAANQPRSSVSDESETTMFQYYIEELLHRLDQSDDISEERVALIEWRYLPLLIHSRRTTLTLHKAMAQRPELFVMVLSSLYKPDPESGVVEEPAEDEVNAEALAKRAYNLLESWHLVPGCDGTNIDAAILEDWIQKTRLLLEKIGRSRIGDHFIGQMLAYSPPAADSVWPAIVVRDVIKITRSHDLDRGVIQGLCNKRGPHWRDPFRGGEAERGLATQYRSWAQSMELEWPRTSAILEQVARSYESHGQSMDAETERRNW
jgi:hypothetical protein